MSIGNHGLRQIIAAKILNVTLTTVSKYLTAHSISPLNGAERLLGNQGNKYSIEDMQKFFKKHNRVKSSKKDVVISFYNFKGGTGKTSMAFQVSSHLAILGFEVLVIDADPQAHLTCSLGIDELVDFPTIHDVMIDRVNVKDAIMNIFPGLDCIPSNLALTRLENHLINMTKREEILGKKLRPLEGLYDFIIIDTNPTISLLNRNILACSDLLSIVCETHPYSINGLKILMNDLYHFYDNMQMELPDILVIPNKYEDRSTNSAEGLTTLRDHYYQYMIPDFAVRKSEDIVTSSKLKLPLSLFVKTNSIALMDIRDLSNSIIKRVSESETIGMGAA